MAFVDVTLFIISAILVVNQLTAAASIGVPAVGWWVLTIVVFFVPSALITAELGTAYPYQGGIYDWVDRSFGAKWAARATYWYWVNVALWMPSVCLLFTGALTVLVWQGASIWSQSLVAIGLVWLTVLVGTRTLRVGKSVTGTGAVVKVAIILVIGGGAIALAIGHGAANHFTVRAMLPNLGVTKTYLPVLVYQLMGFELVSSLSGELKNPRRDVARGIGLSGMVISALYILGTVGILLALPLKQLGLTAGLVETFQAVFGSGSPLPWLLGIAVMAAYVGNMITWSLGANRSAMEAAEAGRLPMVFAVETRKGSPLWAYVLTGLVSTTVLLFAAIFLRSQDRLYYAIFAASSVIFLLPHVLMFPAVIRLRRIDPGTERPFRVPGGAVGLWLAVALATGSVLAALVLFLWTPGVPIDWSYTGPLLGIVAAALAVGEVVIAWRPPRRLDGDGPLG